VWHSAQHRTPFHDFLHLLKLPHMPLQVWRSPPHHRLSLASTHTRPAERMMMQAADLRMPIQVPPLARHHLRARFHKSWPRLALHHCMSPLHRERNRL